LIQLAKLQGIAKWLVERNIDVDMDAVLAHINRCIQSKHEVTKVPALSRTENSSHIHGGVDLSIRQQATPTRPCTATEQVQLQTMMANCTPATSFTIPFLKRKYCHQCDRPLSFDSPFLSGTAQETDNKWYCDEHHPDACPLCLLPLYRDPSTLELATKYSIISLPKHDDTPFQYHPQCFKCISCNEQIEGTFKRDALLEHAFMHTECEHPLTQLFSLYPYFFSASSFAPQNPSNANDRDDNLLQRVQEESRREYEQQKTRGNNAQTELEFRATMNWNWHCSFQRKNTYGMFNFFNFIHTL
jgi:hypothetical protein